MSYLGRVLGFVALLAFGGGAALAEDGEGWSVPGFKAEMYRHPLDPAADPADYENWDAAGLRFLGPDGKVVAAFTGQGDTESWELLRADIRIEGVAEPLAAFRHYWGGAHCCSRVEVFRLGGIPGLLAVSPRQEGDTVGIVETPAGWFVPSHDASFAYAFDRSFAGSPFPPVYWRLTAAGFVPAPEQQRVDAAGRPALLEACRRPGVYEEGVPSCDDVPFYLTGDAELAALLAEVAPGAGQEPLKWLARMPAAVFERFAEGEAAKALALLKAAGAPPEVGRILVQAFAARHHWRELVALNGFETLVAPLLEDGIVVPAAGRGLVQPVSALRGPLAGFARIDCPADGEARVELLDRFGAGLGLATLDHCPVLASPLYLGGKAPVPALLAAYRGEAISALVVPTAAGGMVVPVDVPDLEVIGATDADGDGKAETIAVKRSGRAGEPVTCPLSEAPALIACLDGLP
ncbi:hypothetical protein [Zavarzinia compransoris]|uniref:WG repeat-containing protein n=1 Tax=Zavarzinia compransoris TaxID=1264899 RepID=A0A317ECI8_9PROT|nr:hypothetical protein [Zavarzinia compransoris]PWR24004.1 hypothetical protein DKG75_05535 [Zavarzinia compransoris]TDP48264.1 hypothetical protein DES42_102567 [Zavarzinia compransoris]